MYFDFIPGPFLVLTRLPWLNNIVIIVIIIIIIIIIIISYYYYYYYYYYYHHHHHHLQFTEIRSSNILLATIATIAIAGRELGSISAIVEIEFI